MIRPSFFSHASPEELANSVSHGVGLVAALLGAPLLLETAARQNGHWALLGAVIFAGAMILLYLSSTIYHALFYNEKLRYLFRIFDHSAIFLLIAGTYTPFTFGVLRGLWGWILLALVWGLALLGMVLVAMERVHHPLRDVGLYLLMGWLLVMTPPALLLSIPTTGLLLLLSGGIAYTAGVVFFAAQRLRYGHFVWHLFVLVGTCCHYFAVLWYAN